MGRDRAILARLVGPAMRVIAAVMRDAHRFGRQIAGPGLSVRRTARGPATWVIAALMVCGGVVSPAATQVLAPPSLPGQDDLAREIVRAIERKDVGAYEALLAENVQVFEDNRIIATSRAAWMKTFGEKLGAKGVSFRVAPGYSSTGRILFIEYFNSVASFDSGTIGHCCWSHDAVAYDTDGMKITRISRLKGGDRTLP